MESSIQVYRPTSRGHQTFILVLMSLICFAALRVDDWIPRIIGAVLLLGLANAFFDREIHIDTRKRSVIQVANLLGLMFAWKRERPFTDFTAVELTRWIASDNESWDYWEVALKPRSGMAIRIRKVPANTDDVPAKARAFARELSELVGLEIVEREMAG